MKGSNTSVGNMTIEQIPKEVLPNTTGQNMKMASTPVDNHNVIIKQFQSEVLINTKGNFMKVNNILAYSAGKI